MIGVAPDPFVAARRIAEDVPDVITLDVEASDTIAIVKTKFYLKTKSDPEEGEQLYFGIVSRSIMNTNIQKEYIIIYIIMFIILFLCVLLRYRLYVHVYLY